MKWNKDTIGSVAKVISGYAFKSASFQPEGKVPVIKIANIKRGGVDLTQAAMVDESFLSIDSKFHVRKGDVLISLTGSHINLPSSVVGRVAKYRHDSTSLLNQRAGKFLHREESVDLNFLYYFLSMDETLVRIASFAQGAANQANISPSNVESVEITLPPLPTQRRIASILSAYDDLIENNLRRIKLLEEAARCEYKMLMEGSQSITRPLLDICHITDGTHESPKQQEIGFYLVTGKHLINGLIDFTTSYHISEKDHEQIQKRSSLDNGDVILSNIGTLGNVAIIDSPFVFSVKNVIIFKPKAYFYSPLLYCYLTSEEMQAKFQQESSGTSQRFLSLKYCRGLDISLPPEAELREFSISVSNVLRLKSILSQQNTRLRQARDIFLPKLMSGEIEMEGDISTSTLLEMPISESMDAEDEVPYGVDKSHNQSLNKTTYINT